MGNQQRGVVNLHGPFDLVRRELRPVVGRKLSDRGVENINEAKEEIVDRKASPELASKVGLLVLEDDDELEVAAERLVDEYIEESEE